MTWVGVLVALVAGALGGAAGILKVRPERRKINADAALTLQQATTEGIENIRHASQEAVAQARANARRAHQEAVEARRDAEGARAELGQLRAELLQARAEMAELRRQAAAERAAAAAEKVSAEVTIRDLTRELQLARFGGFNGSAGVLGEFGS